MRLFWLSVCVLCGATNLAHTIAGLVVGFTVVKYVFIWMLPTEER
jgi:hypothetical protein